MVVELSFTIIPMEERDSVLPFNWSGFCYSKLLMLWPMTFDLNYICTESFDTCVPTDSERVWTMWGGGDVYSVLWPMTYNFTCMCTESFDTCVPTNCERVQPWRGERGVGGNKVYFARLVISTKLLDMQFPIVHSIHPTFPPVLFCLPSTF